jgi:hypothetical protein
VSEGARHTRPEHLHEALSAETGVVRQGHVLPAEVEVHQQGDRIDKESRARGVQALLAGGGGVQGDEGVLQPEDDPMLRDGRLLPEEPHVLQPGQDSEVLSRRAEVRDPHPRR